MKADIQQFMGLLFASRDYAHKAHLNTDSYAQHKALNKFYTDIIDLADDLAESWMGRNNQKIGDIPSITPPKGEALAVMKRVLEVIQDTRDFVGNDTVLSNIIDEIEALYSSTIYKLRFLK
jgi:DNA-binding ferritin-like protein